MDSSPQQNVRCIDSLSLFIELEGPLDESRMPDG